MRKKLLLERRIKITNPKTIFKFNYYQTFLDLFKSPKYIEVDVEPTDDTNKFVIKTTLSKVNGLVVNRNDLIMLRVMYGRGIGVIIELHHITANDETQLLDNEAFVAMNLKLKYLLNFNYKFL